MSATPGLDLHLFGGPPWGSRNRSNLSTDYLCRCGLVTQLADAVELGAQHGLKNPPLSMGQRSRLNLHQEFSLLDRRGRRVQASRSHPVAGTSLLVVAVRLEIVSSGDAIIAAALPSARDVPIPRTVEGPSHGHGRPSDDGPDLGILDVGHHPKRSESRGMRLNKLLLAARPLGS